MPFEEAIGRLKAYEDRLRVRNKNASNEGSLLLTKSAGSSQKISGRFLSPSGGRGSPQGDRWGRNGGRDRGRGRGGQGSSSGQRDFADSHYKPRDKKHIKCFNCEEYGHYASECKAPKGKSEEVNLTQTQDEEPYLLLGFCQDKTTMKVLLNEDRVSTGSNNDKASEDAWYLDNGASTGIKEHLAELNENVTGQVRFGDGSMVQIKGEGSILLNCRNGEQIILPDVYYIPALHNILSLGQLTKIGYKVEMMDDYLKVSDENW
ncbi:uncharacterized protein LOC127240896 [Andrographis paniculata]|uniref:uncharacterized protein LOC127240896 n=1 Tax=Andrographis paniculata TaxID=175694 RepID=UPI0021E96E6A|nr:uncharacterized protein LOC127240896 [Andrographis paniculata]